MRLDAHLREWLIREESSKVGHDLICGGREVDVLRDRAVGERVLQMVRVDGRAVRDDGDVVPGLGSGSGSGRAASTRTSRV